MTLDGSDPLWAKQCFCFKFLRRLPVLCVVRFSPAHRAESWDSTKDEASHSRLLEPVIHAPTEQGSEGRGSDVRACVRACRTGCSTHLQDGVFREVCAVDGVFHSVFAVKRSQRVRPEILRDFLLGGGGGGGWERREDTN